MPRAPQALQVDLLHVVGRGLEDDLELVEVLQAVRVVAVAAVRGAARGLDVGRAPGLGPDAAEEGRRVEGAPLRIRCRRAAGRRNRVSPKNSAGPESRPGSAFSTPWLSPPQTGAGIVVFIRAARGLDVAEAPFPPCKPQVVFHQGVHGVVDLAAHLRGRGVVLPLARPGVAHQAQGVQRGLGKRNPPAAARGRTRRTRRAPPPPGRRAQTELSKSFPHRGQVDRSGA